jgi:hypothetical protein
LGNGRRCAELSSNRPSAAIHSLQAQARRNRARLSPDRSQGRRSSERRSEACGCPCGTKMPAGAIRRNGLVHPGRHLALAQHAGAAGGTCRTLARSGRTRRRSRSGRHCAASMEALVPTASRRAASAIMIETRTGTLIIGNDPIDGPQITKLPPGATSATGRPGFHQSACGPRQRTAMSGAMSAPGGKADSLCSLQVLSILTLAA